MSPWRSSGLGVSISTRREPLEVLYTMLFISSGEEGEEAIKNSDSTVQTPADIVTSYDVLHVTE